MDIIWQIQALVRTLPLNAVLKIIYLKHKLQTSKHNLMQAHSDQWLPAIFEIQNSNLTSSFTWQIPALVRVLPLNAILKVIYLKHEFQPTNTILCKPMVTISGQHFLKFEIHNANLTSSFTRYIPALVGGLTSQCRSRNNLPEI